MATFLSNEFLEKNEEKIIDQLIEDGTIVPIDQIFANKIAPNCSFASTLFLCYLFASYRNGHLCVKIDENSINPCWDQWNLLIKQGSQDIPKDIIGHDEAEQKPLIRQENCWYLHINWHYETLFLQHWQRLQEAKPILCLPTEEIRQKLNLEVTNKILKHQQADAIYNACNYSLSLIFGGPGTGKSFTAAHLIKVIYSHLSDDVQKKFSITLAAPTGKAIIQLKNKLLNLCPELHNHPFFSACTIHSLLENRRYYVGDYLYCDLLIIDESSMIDMHRMTELLQKIKTGVRVIFIGDPDQIPPIETGMIFKELKQLGQSVNSTTLEECVRSESLILKNLADSIRHIHTRAVIEIIDQQVPDIERISFKTPLELVKTVVNYHLDYTSSSIKEKKQHFCALGALRKGHWGIDQLNLMCLQEHQKIAFNESDFCIPIMIAVNQPKQDLYNGDVGFLFKKAAEAIFFDSQGQIRTIPQFLLPHYEYAYFISIHKSQGSEYDEALVILPEGSETFGRELLYTAVTRVRKKLILSSTDQTLAAIMEHDAHRLSNILERWPQLTKN